ncbi:hypothetical protein LTS18_006558 [Coniosporium uncinatum]|uniref:Uncharacterized protein n=1 Tax=Coniosporium uncinatum TaxID=93489 RepID=A0ACC3DQF4_9PEZI|nr:hypothetical protein LTS18_006558 [Coniosporium uncinatum]
MYSSTALSTLSLLALSLTSTIYAQTSPPTGLLGDAQIVTINPAGASYIALLPNSPLNTVRGSLTAITSPSNSGIDVALTLSGLPTEGGPFLYHIHVDPVPADGNCTATLAHLDPFVRGEDPPCDAARKETCQVGDLSGKYGKINGTGLSQSYTDPDLSLQPGLGSFFGNRSLVIHYANKTRITCANFTMIDAGYDPSNQPITVPNATAFLSSSIDSSAIGSSSDIGVSATQVSNSMAVSESQMLSTAPGPVSTGGVTSMAATSASGPTATESTATEASASESLPAIQTANIANVRRVGCSVGGLLGVAAVAVAVL